jgi:hypothetical protein
MKLPTALLDSYLTKTNFEQLNEDQLAKFNRFRDRLLEFVERVSEACDIDEGGFIDVQNFYELKGVKSLTVREMQLARYCSPMHSLYLPDVSEIELGVVEEILCHAGRNVGLGSIKELAHNHFQFLDVGPEQENPDIDGSIFLPQLESLDPATFQIILNECGEEHEPDFLILSERCWIESAKGYIFEHGGEVEDQVWNFLRNVFRIPYIDEDMAGLDVFA